MVSTAVLEPIDKNIVPVDLLDPGSVDEYGIKVEENGTVFTWNKNSFRGDKPTGPADLFDLEKFPGKRCLYKKPTGGGVLESALYADGVAAKDIYPLDVDRALKKLETIKDDVIWWDSGATATQLITSGECSMGMMWTGRIYDAIEKQALPPDFTWDGGVSTTAYYAVPKDAKDKKRCIRGDGNVGFGSCRTS